MNIPDYDSGSLNDYGGGNVDWWWDYIRAEIGRCNDYWREQLEQVEPAVEAGACKHEWQEGNQGEQYCWLCGEGSLDRTA